MIGNHLGHSQSAIPQPANPAFPAAWADLRWDARGLIPAVVQDVRTGAVLMMAWMNQDALRQTLATGEAHFWSRSRGELWHKGATSGHIQRVKRIWLDCDGDTLLLQVEPAGPACHTGATSCFFRPFGAQHPEEAKGDERSATSPVEED